MWRAVSLGGEHAWYPRVLVGRRRAELMLIEARQEDKERHHRNLRNVLQAMQRKIIFDAIHKKNQLPHTANSLQPLVYPRADASDDRGSVQQPLRSRNFRSSAPRFVRTTMSPGIIVLQAHLDGMSDGFFFRHLLISAGAISFRMSVG